MCENGATAEFSEELWGLVNINPNNNAKIKCSIDFKNGTSLIEYLRNLNSSELVEDEYGNLRYVGKNPNNYVSFNNELWRIIGVMKDIENPDGSKEDKVKLIRSGSIGDFYWDSKAKGVGSSTASWGSNKWNDSQLMMMLNPSDRIPANYTIDNDGYVLDQNGIKIFKNPGSYWNRTTGYKPASATTNSFTENSVNFSNIGLIEEARNMISTSTWTSNVDIRDMLTLQETSVESFYLKEKKDIKWIGEVGLLYPSELGYATSGGETTSRTVCLESPLRFWYEKAECPENDWLSSSSTNTQWSMVEYPNGTNVFDLYTGLSYSEPNQRSYKVKPVVHLNSKIRVIENESVGSSASPFVLKF